jgi:hypothetical protein
LGKRQPKPRASEKRSPARILGASFTNELEGTTATKPIPEGYHTITPYLAVDDAAEAIEYYKKAFGAKERVRMDAPDDKIVTRSSRSGIRW